MAHSPSLSDLPKYPVSAGVGLIALGLFVAIGNLSDPSAQSSVDPFVLDQRAFWAEPWRLLTSTVVHANFIHVGFNVWWMWLLGTYVEASFGHLRALGLMLLLAVGSAAAEYTFSTGGVGLSGVVYGLFGFLWALDRYSMRHRGAMDRQRTRFFVFWFFLCIVLTHFDVLRIANVAHGSGAVFGGLVGVAFALPGAKRYASIAGLAALLGVSTAGATEFRGLVNPTAAATQAFDDGIKAFEAERWEDAIAQFEKAAESDLTAAAAWYNIGLCKLSLHDYSGALAAHERALALEPGNSQFSDSVEELTGYVETAEKLQADTEAPGSPPDDGTG
jgi:membrane associated rhomboid family serine protease